MIGASVKGRRVLVTGGSKGIGYGIAEVFADAGAIVTIAGRDEEALATAQRLLSRSGAAIYTVTVDVTDPDSCTEMARASAESMGGIDVVCANAGVFPVARIETMTPEQLNTVMATNFHGTVFTVQATLPWLKQSDQARIVVTSSITGPVTAYPGWSHYGASKAAQLGFVRTAAMELAPSRITINAVLPGNISTEGLDELGDDYRERMAATIPLQRLGSVHDVGNAALFFASAEAGYITGQTLIIDGGQTLPESAFALNELQGEA